MHHIFAKRIACYKDTQARVRQLPPPPQSVKLSDKHLQPLQPTGAGTNNIAVCGLDSIDCGLEFLRRGYNPLVMNLADEFWPGGCVDTGSGAQEESLFRRTNLCATLTYATRMYPILDNELIYSPGVSVLKTSEATGWRVLSPPYEKLSFVSCPGLRFPKVIYPHPDATLHEGRLQPVDVERLRTKIRLILRCAAVKGHDVVILGALGCGAWKNPGPHVAEIFAEVLAEPEFGGRFAHLVFAIMRSDDRCDNFSAFQARFAPG